MEKAKDSLRCLMFPWFCKLVSTFYPRLFKNCCSVDVPYLQEQAQMEFRSRPSLSRPQDCYYNDTNFNPSRLFKAILSWKWCIQLCTWSGFISKRRQRTTSPCGFSFIKFHGCRINYEIHNKELLTIVNSFQEWRHFPEGAVHPIIVYTDHKNLKYFMSACVLNRCQAL